MSVLIASGGSGATGSLSATGETRVIAAGNFSGNSSVSVEIAGDSQRKCIVHTFTGRDGVIVSAAVGDVITATVVGGDASTSIDVSASAI